MSLRVRLCSKIVTIFSSFNVKPSTYINYLSHLSIPNCTLTCTELIRPYLVENKSCHLLIRSSKAISFASQVLEEEKKTLSLRANNYPTALQCLITFSLPSTPSYLRHCRRYTITRARDGGHSYLFVLPPKLATTGTRVRFPANEWSRCTSGRLQ